MSTHIKIISQKDISLFDNPPEFNAEERKKFFLVHVWAKEVLKDFRTSANKVGFLLQLGYFRSTNKFFPIRTFHQKDVNFAINRLELWVYSNKGTKRTIGFFVSPFIGAFSGIFTTHKFQALLY